VLAAAAAIGVVAAVLQVVATSLVLSELFRFPALTQFKVANGLEVLGWVFVVGAFAAAFIGFLLESRRTLAVSAGLFVGFGVSTLASALIELVESWGSAFEPWEFKADGIGEAAAAASLAVAALLVLIGFLSARPDRFLGWGSVGLAGYAGLLAAAFSFNLAGFLRFGEVPGAVSWGLGTRAGGQFVVAVAAIVAAVAFFSSSGRRERGEPWAAEREGSLGTASIVFAVGFLVTSVGLMLLASQISGGAGREEAAYWLMAVGQLFLAFAAVCGAIGFFSSRRDAKRRAAPQTTTAATD
jgi:hypothetical protein